MNKIGECKVGMRGFFQLSACQKDESGAVIPGTERDLGEFENLITDNGLELLKGEAFLGYIQVGSGSAAPTNSDTSLGAWVAGAGGGDPSQGPSDLSANPPWVSATQSVQFGKGVAAGNLSEIGVGPSAQGNLFSRALIKDAGGNPTTITVLAIEYLTVTYTWRLYFDTTASTASTVTIDGASYDTVAMVGAIDAYAAYGWARGGGEGGLNGFANNSIAMQAYSGALNAAGIEPSGSINYVNGSYTPGPTGSYYMEVSAHVGTGSFNSGSGISAIVAGKQNDGLPSVKIGFTPSIPKDNTKEMDIVARITWGRYIP